MNTYTAAAWQWQPTYNYYSPNELYHHGIMGMRWGKRHGPPYPLAPSAHSAEEKRLKSKNEGKLESWKAKEKSRRGLDDRLLRNRDRKPLSTRQIKKLEEYYASKMTVQEAKKIRSLLQKADDIDDAYRKEWDQYVGKFVKDPNRKKMYDGFDGDGGELTEMMERVLPNSKLRSLGNQGQQALNEAEEYVRSVAKRITSEGKYGDRTYNEKTGIRGYTLKTTAERIARTGINRNANKEQARRALTQRYAIPMQDRVNELSKKDRRVKAFMDSNGLDNRNIARYIKITQDKELQRLYDDYLKQRKVVVREYGKIGKWE